jgi:hypothetical protein
MLGLIKRKFCGFAHTTVWAKLMHGHLLSRHYYVLIYKNIYKYAVYVKGFETPNADNFFQNSSYQTMSVGTYERTNSIN